MTSIQIVNKSKHQLPKYETIQSAGMDIRANIEEPITLKPLERALVKTGLFIALEIGYEAQVRPRSGLAFKKGITVLNSPGTIDSDYRGEIKVILINHSQDDFIVKNQDRIAQVVFSEFKKVSLEETDNLDETSRGQKGFGSTGK